MFPLAVAVRVFGESKFNFQKTIEEFQMFLEQNSKLSVQIDFDCTTQTLMSSDFEPCNAEGITGVFPDPAVLNASAKNFYPVETKINVMFYAKEATTPCFSGLTLDDGLNHVPFVMIPFCNEAKDTPYWNTPYTCVLIHEFLHALAFLVEQAGFPVGVIPDPDDAEKYGYTYEEDSDDKEFYTWILSHLTDEMLYAICNQQPYSLFI